MNTNKADMGKKDLIMDAALHLFSKNGYKSTKIIDIAEEANIGKGTVYEYFQSKEDLFTQLFQRKIFVPYQDMERILLENENAEDQLKAYIKYELGVMKRLQIRNHMAFVMESDLFPEPVVKKCVSELMRFRFSILHTIVKQGVQKQELAKANPLLVSVSLFGAITLYLNFSFDVFESNPLAGYGQLEINEEALFDLLFSGICAK